MSQPDEDPDRLYVYAILGMAEIYSLTNLCNIPNWSERVVG